MGGSEGAVRTVVDALRRSTAPEQVATAGPVYEAACTLWSAAVATRPAVVLRCTSTADVQAGVRAARDAGLPLSVRGGGHGWSGAALVQDGVVLDLSGLRGVHVDPAAGHARLGGGATTLDLVTAAEAHDRVAVTGTSGAVGVAGFCLGGGYGPLSGRFGLGVDNVLGAEVVLADGSVVTTDAEHDPDLFWALRGGGGNLGVVTAVRVAVHEVPSLLGGMLLFPWDQAATVLDGLAGHVLDGPDALTVQCGVVVGPTGEPTVFVIPTWCGAPDEGARHLETLTRLGQPLVAQVGPVVTSQSLAGTDALFPAGRHVEIRPRSVTGLTAGVRETVHAAGETLTSPLSSVSLHALHGAAARVPVGETAFAARSPHLMVETIAVWEPGDPGASEHRAWARGVSAALRPDALPGGYVNLLGPDETEEADAAYGPNRDRLVAIKDRVDPDGVFAATPFPTAARSSLPDEGLPALDRIAPAGA